MKAIKRTQSRCHITPSLLPYSHLQNLLKSSHHLKPKSLNPLLANHSTKPMSISPSLRLSLSQTLYQLPHQPFKPDTRKIPSFSSIPTSFFSIKTITIDRLSTKRIFSTPSSSPSPELQPLDELPEQLQGIIKLFQGVKEPRAKYEQLLFYGRNMEPLDDKFKTSENKVQGCVSQVWVRAYLDSDKNVIFQADSDSSLTKGLAALLVQGLSGRPVEEIVRVSPDFVALLGLQQSLTPSRNNGFLNMLKLMQKKALRLYLEAEKNGTASNGLLSGPAEDSILTLKSDGRNGDGLEAEKDGAAGIGLRNGPADDSMLTMKSGGNGDVKTGLSSTEYVDDLKSANSSNDGLGSRGLRIKEKLERELRPIELEIEDISYQHAGHAGVRDSNGETHFNVKVVSAEFEGKSLVKRHRLIYNLLQDELQCGLHALSIVAKSPSELNTS